MPKNVLILYELYIMVSIMYASTRSRHVSF